MNYRLGVVRLPRASGADEGVAAPRIRQLRRCSISRRAEVGAEEHRGVRRRSGARDDLRRVGRIVERERRCWRRRSRRDCSTARSARAAGSSRERRRAPTPRNAVSGWRRRSGRASLADLRAVPRRKLLAVDTFRSGVNVDGYVLPEDVRTIFAAQQAEQCCPFSSDRTRTR